MRVVVFSKVRLFAQGISAFFECTPGIEAVLVEYDAEGLESRIAGFRADVVLFDVTSREVMSAARLVAALCPEVTTVAMAVAEVADEVIACAEAGFAAYIPRNASAEEMIGIVDLARRGETVCDRRIARSLFNELARRSTAPRPAHTECLTHREGEIARMLARGLSNKEIAKELHLSVATIKNHVHSTLAKLQVSGRAQVANLLVQNPSALRLAPDPSSIARALPRDGSSWSAEAPGQPREPAARASPTGPERARIAPGSSSPG